MFAAQKHGLSTAITTLPRLDPDVALVRQFRATGDPRCFETLFRKYQKPVFHIVSRMTGGEDAYDLTQEVFVRALRSLGSFHGACKFRTWLYTIARNVCLNHLRDERAGREAIIYSLDDDTEQHGGPEPADPNSDVPRIVETHDLQQMVDKTLGELPPDQRLLITLRDLEGLSYDEIAEVTDMSLVNVKSRLHRARLAFKSKASHWVTESGER